MSLKARRGEEAWGDACKEAYSPSTPLKETQKEKMLYNQLESIFESLPDSVIVCDQEGKIIRINAAALKLFEVPSEARWKGTSYQQFLQDYQLCDERQPPISLAPWLMNLVIDDEAVSSSPEKTLILQMPSGRKVYVNLWCLPVFDSQKHTVGTFSVFHSITHRYQKALHLQRVHEATLTLTDAIAHIPEHIDFASPEETLLLSPPVTFVAQQLVDVIRQVLDCCRVSLLAFGPAGYIYRIAGSGFSAEREQYWRKAGGRFLPSEFVDETVLACLSANQEVILTNDYLRRPHSFPEFSNENRLLIPLFLEQQWAGTLIITKAGSDSGYTPDEVALVKAVAAQTVLVIECLHCLHKQAETRTRALVQQEIHRLSNDFLTLASHELRTPLTAIIGNIQLAQRRLEALKHQVVEQPERMSEKIEHVQQPLASASQSAYLQKHTINDIINDARIQTKQLNLLMNHCDLLTLLKDAVARQQRSLPEHTIILKILPTEQQGVPVFADAERIIKVLNTYLANALNHSPIGQPVTIELVVADTVALVSVHDEGLGIPPEEQELLWERFYRAKGSAVQHELDLSLGLGFHLCRALIEYHHGHVGVQSDPGHGETFWLSLPLVASPERG